MNWSDYNGSGVKITGRTIVKGRVYIIGTELASSVKCSNHPTTFPALISPDVLNQQVPTSVKNIFAGVAPAPFSAKDGLQWKNTNLVELDSLYATGGIYSLAPARTMSTDLTPENATTCEPDTRLPVHGHVDNSTTPGVLKDATTRWATLPS